MLLIKRQQGFTVVELIIVMTIMLVLSTVSVIAFRNMQSSQALTIALDETGYALRSARDATLASLEGSVYGVRFEPTNVIRFTGSTYSASSSSNIIYDLPTGISTTVAMADGTSQVVFRRLSGEASATGTIIFTEAKSGATSSLAISKTGLFDSDQ